MNRHTFIGIALLAVLALAAVPAREARAETTPRPGVDPWFVGGWWQHGASLEIFESGVATLVFRTYVWCERPEQRECDRIVGNVIMSGGRANMIFTETTVIDEPDFQGIALEGRVTDVRGAQRMHIGEIALVAGWSGLGVLVQDGEILNPDVRWCGPAYDVQRYVADNSPCGA